MRCHDDMFRGLLEAGYVPHRLGIQAVELLPEPVDGSARLLATLKKALDPNNILAPGRYGLVVETKEKE